MAQLFSEHPVRSTLSRTEEALEVTRIIADETSVDASELHNRLRHLVRYVGEHLKTADPLLALTGPLTQLNTHLDRLSSELENFRSHRSLSHLAQAATHGENAVAQVASIPLIRQETDVHALQEAIVSFRRSLGQHLRHFEEQVNTANAELNRLRSHLDSALNDVQQTRINIDNSISRLESQYAESESRRRTAFQSSLAQMQQQASDIEQRVQKLQIDAEARLQAIANDAEQRTLTVISDLERRFQSAQDTRTSRFDQLLDESKLRFGQLLEQTQIEREQAFDKLESEATRYREQLERRKEEVEKLVGAVAQTGMVSGYQKVANHERWSMRVWQLITVTSICAFVVLMLITIPPPESALSWQTLISRALAALGFAGLAAYAGRESSKHGEKERLLRQLELEIASVGPFLATIPKDDQDAIKKAIADRTFGRGSQPLTVESVPATTNGLIELLRTVLSELIKRTK